MRSTMTDSTISDFIKKLGKFSQAKHFLDPECGGRAKGFSVCSLFAVIYRDLLPFSISCSKLCSASSIEDLQKSRRFSRRS